MRRPPLSQFYHQKGNKTLLPTSYPAAAHRNLPQKSEDSEQRRKHETAKQIKKTTTQKRKCKKIGTPPQMIMHVHEITNACGKKSQIQTPLYVYTNTHDNVLRNEFTIKMIILCISIAMFSDDKNERFSSLFLSQLMCAETISRVEKLRNYLLSHSLQRGEQERV